MTTQIRIDPLPLDVLTDRQLLAQYEDSRTAVSAALIAKGHLEQEIYLRMENRGSTSIPDNTYVCELVPQNTYLQEAFTPLKEVLVSADLKQVLMPAHPETIEVPDKWNTTRILALARRLPEVNAITDQARVEGRPKLKFEVRQ
mgnify:CR=1 FL=1